MLIEIQTAKAKVLRGNEYFISIRSFFISSKCSCETREHLWKNGHDITAGALAEKCRTDLNFLDHSVCVRLGNIKKAKRKNHSSWHKTWKCKCLVITYAIILCEISGNDKIFIAWCDELVPPGCCGPTPSLTAHPLLLRMRKNMRKLESDKILVLRYRQEDLFMGSVAGKTDLTWKFYLAIYNKYEIIP